MGLDGIEARKIGECPTELTEEQSEIWRPTLADTHDGADIVKGQPGHEAQLGQNRATPNSVIRGGGAVNSIIDL